LNAYEVVHPHAHATKCQRISETSSKILESRKKKNLGKFEQARLQNLRRRKISRNLRRRKISKSLKKKYQNLGKRRTSESKNEKNLRILEKEKSQKL
jgi:BioD-like phosphotransacetylase family protein